MMTSVGDNFNSMIYVRGYTQLGRTKSSSVFVLRAVADPEILKKRYNVSEPSSFIANAHNAFYAGKGGLLKKNLPTALIPPMNPPLITGTLCF